MIWIIYIGAWCISIACAWKALKIWKDNNKAASIATLFLAAAIVAVTVMHIFNQGRLQ